MKDIKIKIKTLEDIMQTKAVGFCANCKKYDMNEGRCSLKKITIMHGMCHQLEKKDEGK